MPYVLDCIPGPYRSVISWSGRGAGEGEGEGVGEGKEEGKRVDKVIHYQSGSDASHSNVLCAGDEQGVGAGARGGGEGGMGEGVAAKR